MVPWRCYKAAKGRVPRWGIVGHHSATRLADICGLGRAQDRTFDSRHRLDEHGIINQELEGFSIRPDGAWGRG